LQRGASSARLGNMTPQADLIRELKRGEGFLLQQISSYIKESDQYKPYKSVKEEDWRAALCASTDVLVWYLEHHNNGHEHKEDNERLNRQLSTLIGLVEPIAKCAREGGFGLLVPTKLMRQAFADLIGRAHVAGEERVLALSIMHSFFDRIELGFGEGWMRQGTSGLDCEAEGADRTDADRENGYLAIFRSLPHPAILVKQDLRIVEANPAFENLLQLGGVEYRGRFCHEILNCSDPASCPLQACMDNDEAFSGVEEVVCVSGKPRTILVSGSRLDGRNAAHRLGIAVFQDITARKNEEELYLERMRLSAFISEIGAVMTRVGLLQEALQNCAELMVTLLDAVLARIWLFDEQESMLELKASAGLYTHLNGAHSRIPLGRLKIGRIAKTRKPHLTNDVCGDPMFSDPDWAVREGIVAFAGYPMVVEGRVLGVMALFARTALNQSVLQALGTAADRISLGIERKRAEEALRLSQDFCAVVLDAMQDAISIVDIDDFTIESANKAFYDSVGRSPADVLGKTCYSVTHGRDKPCAPPEDPCPISAVLQIGRPTALEHVHYDRAGNPVFVEVTASPIKGEDGKIGSIVHVARDITERKKAERALQESKAVLQENRQQLQFLTARLMNAQEEERRRLSRELHDDINQRLGILSLDLDVLGQELPESASEVREQLQSFRNRVAELSDSVHDLAYELHPSILDHLGLTVALKSYLRDWSKREQIRTKFTNKSIPESIDQNVGTCLYRVAQESLRNVARHSGSRRVSVAIVGSPRLISLSVRDYGKGFDAGAEHSEGHGLGIMSMKERVRLVNGSFKLKSSPGQGTQIVARIPLHPEPLFSGTIPG
jgi:PAS domain S-box-containing protein